MWLNLFLSGEKNMAPENLSIRILFFFQTAVGIFGNWSILLPHVASVFTGTSLMPKDQILRHLTLANSLVIISRVIPHIMAQLGLQYLLDDLLCKLTLYSNRVSRGISLHCTCLLSCFQAITISPSNSRWMKLKHSVSKYMVQSCSLSWLVHLLLNSKTVGVLLSICFSQFCTWATSVLAVFHWWSMFGSHGLGQCLHGEYPL